MAGRLFAGGYFEKAGTRDRKVRIGGRESPPPEKTRCGCSGSRAFLSSVCLGGGDVRTSGRHGAAAAGHRVQNVVLQLVEALTLEDEGLLLLLLLLLHEVLP